MISESPTLKTWDINPTKNHSCLHKNLQFVWRNLFYLLKNLYEIANVYLLYLYHLLHCLIYYLIMYKYHTIIQQLFITLQGVSMN